MLKEKLIKEICKILDEYEILDEKKESYYSGLSSSTASKRSAQFKRQAAKDSDDPSAYKPAPGESKKTIPS